MDRWIDGAHIGKLHMYVVLLLFLITHNGNETNVGFTQQILLHFVLFSSKVFFFFLKLSGDQAFKRSPASGCCLLGECLSVAAVPFTGRMWVTESKNCTDIFRTVVFVWSQEHVLALTFLKTDDNGTAVTKKKSLRKADWRVIGFFFSPNFFAFFLAKQDIKKKSLFENISSITPTGMSLCLLHSLDLQYFSHQLFGWTLITLITWLKIKRLLHISI